MYERWQRTTRRPLASAVLFGLTMVGALMILVWNTVSFSTSIAASSTIAALLQCLKAAKLGLIAHCVEPSPTSFKIIERRIRQHPVRPKVKLYQYAASATSGIPLDFQASGGTGDHVVGAGGGEKNPWTMQDVVVATSRPKQPTRLLAPCCCYSRLHRSGRMLW